MRRATAIRVWDTLCAGRPPHAVAARIAGALALALIAWAFACAFLLLEPLP